MIRLLLTIVFGMLILASQGCVERTSTGPSGKATSANSSTLGWTKAGEFGGFAEESVSSNDPMEVRFTDGEFKLLSGICATSTEVWACDLGISRIQVFDLNGKHQRNIGLGCPIEGNLPSLSETFIESREREVTDRNHWEDISGNTWRSRKRELFRASDVVVKEEGYYFTDWVKTSFRREPLRNFALYFVTDDGVVSPVDMGTLLFPTYLAVSDTTLAISDPMGTNLWGAYFGAGGWKSKQLVIGAGANVYFPLEEYLSDSEEYLSMLIRMSNSGIAANEYFNLGGIDIAFDKLVTCDLGNRRLQVVSMVYDDEWKFGENVRVILGDPWQGEFRFDSPIDVSIHTDGTLFVLDSGGLEVVILDTTFHRLGSFGKGDLIEPYAIDLSDDGKHCYVADRRDNMIHHYVTSN